MKETYNIEYFNWQKRIGKFGGQANIFKFKDHINPVDTVLDFGCGGGYLLNNLVCDRKLGVEINPVAREQAIQNGVECYSTLDSVPPESINVVISNHALEHVANPLEALEKMRSKILKGGLLILVVPSESNITSFDPNDVNQHLYTWNPQILGNLAVQAGFFVEKIVPIFHKWPPNYMRIQENLGWGGFHFLSRIYGRLHRFSYQIKLVAVNLIP